MAEWRLKLEFVYLDPMLECIYPDGEPDWMAGDEPYVDTLYFKDSSKAAVTYQEAKEILAQPDASDVDPNQAQQDFPIKHGIVMCDIDGNDYGAKLALSEVLEFIEVKDVSYEFQPSAVGTLKPGAILNALTLAGIDLLVDGKVTHRLNQDGKFWRPSPGHRMCLRPQGIGGAACGECETCLENQNGGRWLPVNKVSDSDKWVGQMLEALWPYHIELVRDESMEEGFICFLHPHYGKEPAIKVGGRRPQEALAKGIVSLTLKLFPEEMTKTWKLLQGR